MKHRNLTTQLDPKWHDGLRQVTRNVLPERDVTSLEPRSHDLAWTVGTRERKIGGACNIMFNPNDSAGLEQKTNEP